MNENHPDIKTLHTKLLYVTIALNYLDPSVENGLPHKKFKANCRLKLPEPVYTNSKNADELLEALESKGLIRIGDYDNLKEIVAFDQRILDEISETEELILMNGGQIYKREDGRPVQVEKRMDEALMIQVKLDEGRTFDEVSAEVKDIVKKMKSITREIQKRGDQLSLNRAANRGEFSRRENTFLDRLDESQKVLHWYRGIDQIEKAKDIYTFAEKCRDYIMNDDDEFLNFEKDWKQRIECWKKGSQLRMETVAFFVNEGAIVKRIHVSSIYLFCQFKSVNQLDYFWNYYISGNIAKNYLDGVLAKNFSSGCDIYISEDNYRHYKQNLAQQASLSSSYQLVVAIDLGWTYSGYAGSSRRQYEKDPLNIFVSPSIGSRLNGLKLPTCVLFDPIGNLHSVGFEADYKYYDLCCEDEHRAWYFFRDFKTIPYDKVKCDQNEMVRDDSGKVMRAIKVFSSVIGYLKHQAIKEYLSRFPGVHVCDIRWVLTVPSIWSDSTTQFMRNAAIKGGISSEKLVIAPEPDVASLLFKHLSNKTFSVGNQEYGNFQPGLKYLILDAGGGTIDITVHEVLGNYKVKKLLNVNAGHCGGMTVNAAFFSLLGDIFGTEIMRVLDSKYKCDLLDLQALFEWTKRIITPSTTGVISFNVPKSLTQMLQERTRKDIKEVLKSQPKYVGKLALRRDKLRIHVDLMKTLFDEPCSKILEHLQKLFQKPSCLDIKTIFMVGGFSECSLLHRAVEEHFPSVTIIVPEDAALAILKGAVLYGHEPENLS